MDYILYFVFAGIIVIALIIYWIIEFLVAKKIKLKAIEELDKQISEEENAKNIKSEEVAVIEPVEEIKIEEQQTEIHKPKSQKKKSTSKKK